MCVRHAQKIAKLFFERAKHAVPFQIKYIIHKKIYQPLGPQNTPLSLLGYPSSGYADDGDFGGGK